MAKLSDLNLSDDPVDDCKFIVLARHFATTDAEEVSTACKLIAANKSNTGNGCQFIDSPPLGTPGTTARGDTGEGVGFVYDADGNVIYCAPGFQASFQEIGTSQDTIDNPFYSNGTLAYWTSDRTMAGICTQINPEVSPGVATPAATGYITGIEQVSPDGTAPAQAMTMGDYIANKAAGVCSPKRENGVYIFQSVPTTAANQLGATVQTEIELRRFADYYNESVAGYLAHLMRQPGTDTFLDDALAAVQAFNNEIAPSRVESAVATIPSGQAAYNAKGIFILQTTVQTYAPANVFVLQSTVTPGAGTVTTAVAG